MNSTQERALFLQYGWHYDHMGRKWANHDGTFEMTQDFIVKLTTEPEGDIALMQAIVQLGKRLDSAEPKG